MRGIRVTVECVTLAASASAAKLPDRYFELIAAGLAYVQARLVTDPTADLAKLEANRGWRHFPSAILMAAVLYGKSRPGNRHY